MGVNYPHAPRSTADVNTLNRNQRVANQVFWIAGYMGIPLQTRILSSPYRVTICQILYKICPVPVRYLYEGEKHPPQHGSGKIYLEKENRPLFDANRVCASIIH